MKILKYNYNKTLSRAPKRFNFIKYIQKVKGQLNISSTPTEWEDGETTRLTWMFSANDMRTDGKTAHDAILIHYVLNNK